MMTSNDIDQLTSVIHAKDDDIERLSNTLRDTLYYLQDLKLNFSKSVNQEDIFTISLEKLKKLNQNCRENPNDLTKESQSVLLMLRQEIDSIFESAGLSHASMTSEIMEDKVMVNQQSSILREYTNEISRIRLDSSIDEEDRIELIDGIKALRNSEIQRLIAGE